MARALAVCKGGPLDGQIFSVELSADGAPLPLTSREEVIGVLYSPTGETVDADDPWDVYVDTDGAPVKPLGKHTAAYVYEVM